MDLTWYETLNKPLFTPPSWEFPPAWTILYILMFVSFVVLLRKNTYKDKTNAIILFLTQLLFNFLWSPTFFNWHNIRLAFVIIILLLIFLIATIALFYRISKLSAVLLLPYLLWICFAIYLNFGFMVMN